jgi:hypothetical protein
LAIPLELQRSVAGIFGPGGSIMQGLEKLGEGGLINSSILWAIVIACVVMIFLSAKTEDKKGIPAYTVVAILCFAILYGLNLYVLSWFSIVALSVVVIGKIRRGIKRGVFPIILVIWFLCSLVSFDFVTLAITVGGFAGLYFVALRRNKLKRLGSHAARNLSKEEGFKPRRTRKLIRYFEHAGKIKEKSKDKVVKGAERLKGLLARREAENLELLTHEEAMAAGAKKISQTVEQLEKGEISLEERDIKILNVLGQKAKWIEKQLEHVGPEGLDDERREPLLKFAKQMLKDFDVLISNREYAEKYREKAMDIILKVMDIVGEAAKECRMLKERKSKFEHIKKVTNQEVESLENEIKSEEKKLEKIKSHSKDSNSEMSGVHRRINQLKEEQKKFEKIRTKLDLVIKRLERIWKLHNKSIKDIFHVEKKLDAVSDRFTKFEHKFKKHDLKLTKQHKTYRKNFKDFKEEIPDAILVQLTDDASLILDEVIKILELAVNFNQKEIQPIITESAGVVNKIFFLARAAKYLNKVYSSLAEAYKDITKTGAIITQNAQSRKQLMKIFEEENLEEKETNIAARKSITIQFKVKAAYEELKKGIEDVKKHLNVLVKDLRYTKHSRENVIHRIKKAFQATIKAEIKKGDQVLKFEKKAQKATEQAKKAEEHAKAEELKAKHATG